MDFDERRDKPDNIIDAGIRGLTRGIEGLRDLMSQVGDPTAMPRPKPVSGPGRRPPRQGPRTLPSGGSGVREPTVDVFDEGATIRVVADMPGADPETLQVLGAGNQLTINATGPARRYARVLTLPAPVRTDGGIEPSFINGIMEVLLPAVRPAPVPVPAVHDQAGAEQEGLAEESVEDAAPPRPGARHEGMTDDRDETGTDQRGH